MMHNWARLRNECPLDLKNLCDIGWNLQMGINSAKRSGDYKRIFFVRSELDRMIKRFLGLILNSGNRKEDKQIVIEFREAYSRILGNLDGKENELKKTGGVIDDIALPLYISDVESVLIGDIYDPIKIACGAYPKDSKGFILKTFELVSNSAMVFGGEGRFKMPKRSIKTQEQPKIVEIPMTAEEMGSNEGKKKLREKFESSFPDYEELEEADEILEEEK